MYREGLNASLEAPELEAVLWENPMYGILEGALETGLWRICTDTKLETVDTDINGLRLLRQCSTRRRSAMDWQGHILHTKRWARGVNKTVVHNSTRT